MTETSIPCAPLILTLNQRRVTSLLSMAERWIVILRGRPTFSENPLNVSARRPLEKRETRGEILSPGSNKRPPRGLSIRRSRKMSCPDLAKQPPRLYALVIRRTCERTRETSSKFRIKCTGLYPTNRARKSREHSAPATRFQRSVCCRSSK